MSLDGYTDYGTEPITFEEVLEEFLTDDPSLVVEPTLDDAYADPFQDDGSVELVPEGAPDDAWVVPTPGVDIADLPNYTPDAGDPLAGDPATDMVNWHEQAASDTCAVVSQEFVLEQLTGQEFDESALAAEAEVNGWYEPGAGTSMMNMDKLLEAHGVPTETHMNGTLDDLQSALGEGNKVIVSLDSSEIWEPGEDAMLDDGTDTIPGQGADHAVEVIGVVDTPDGQMVVVNDPGTPEGQGAMIPADEFVAAWDDASNFFVEAGPNADDSIDAFGMAAAA